jgi:SagB-type dehydrogenase family enzyme
LRADGATLRLLSTFCDETEDALEALLEEFTPDSVEHAIVELAAQGVLVPTDDKGVEGNRWSDWGDAAWFFHHMTRDTLFVTDPEEQIAMAASTIAGSPPPARYKCLCNTTQSVIELPKPRELNRGSLSHVLVSRRTCRDFADRELSVADVSDLLFYAGGLLFEHSTIAFGTVLKKCAPSPGARHPTELYPVLRRCSEVPAGRYHYCVQHHALALLRPEEPDGFISAALLNQPYFEAAGMVVFFTCLVERVMWKYKAPRIYRLVHLEAGHYCQNLLLAGTALGLGVFCTGALADSVIEEGLGLDEAEEFVVYAAGAGIPSSRGPYRRAQVRASSKVPVGIDLELPQPIEPTDSTGLRLLGENSGKV